jgi:uncharacterized membrane protein YccC
MIARVGAMDPFVLKSALRAAIVMPLAFALALLVIGSKQMALFAAFGSMALLVFVDFGGAPRERLRAYLYLVAVGVVLIVLGTLCSRSVWLATSVMALVAFAILFAGVLDDYIAAARAAAMLTFVLPVMLPADPVEIPTRLAGWGLAGVLCVSATLLLWPGRPRSTLRRGAARVTRSLAELVEARSEGDRAAGERAAQTAHAETVALRDRFVSMAQRPSGTAGPTAALGRLIEDLGWLYRVADRVPALASAATTCPAERAAILAAVPGALRGVATRLEGAPADTDLELARLRRAHEAFGRAQLAYFESVRADHDEAEATVELEEAYRLRELSLGTLQASRDALQACGESSAGELGQTARIRIDAAGRLVRAHASLDSVWLRNSLRGAAGLALAVLVAQLTDVQHAFWVVLGTMSVLRSSALATSATIAWALLGTLAGIVVGGLIVVAVGGDRGALWAVLPVAVLLAAYAPQAISFAAGQGAFTLVVLVLFNLIEPSGWKVGLVRVEDIALGAAVSLLVGILAWPRGTTTILRRAIGAAYLGAARHLDATITALLGEGEQAQVQSRASVTAREAFDTAQLLDAAVRDYIATRTSVHGRLHDLTVLTAGASRVRRVAHLLQDANAFMRLTPVGEDMPRLARARDAFDVERHARCDWYESLGAAISRELPSPRSEREAKDENAEGPIRAVVLERSTAGERLQPGLAIAWAHRHLDILTDVEPALASAYGRIGGDGRGDAASDAR